MEVTENFVKKSNWFRSKKQRQLLEQMAQPQPLTGNIYRYMAALVNVATGQDPGSSNPNSNGSSGCCSCCGCSSCCDCSKCYYSSWWRLTPGSVNPRKWMEDAMTYDIHEQMTLCQTMSNHVKPCQTMSNL